ncbi:HD domain-containing protein [Nocardia sp. NPDC050408]|uniref:HD domain-containing protein n=1 Tax=Nocardia sp. NPDC050408 TaxID=3364319 RepID=UPI00378C574C
MRFPYNEGRELGLTPGRRPQSGYGDDMAGELLEWAERTAQELLSDLPTRLAHVAGVARRAELVAGLVDDGDLLVAAAWLHDVGYSPQLVRTGFHPVDGAEFLRDQGAPPRLCALVANHSCARVEARNRKVPMPWPDECGPLRDALWWADMTTTPTGDTTDISSRLAEVCERYGPDHIVSRSVTEAAPELLAAGARTMEAAHRSGKWSPGRSRTGAGRTIRRD